MHRLRNTVLAALVASSVAMSPSLAIAQDHDRHDDRRDRHQEYRMVPPEWRHYDYNRFEPGQRHYDAGRYYRWDDHAYKEHRLTQNDLIYRDYDNRYYCRHSDGTTGLIVGRVAGGVLGSIIAPGGSKPLGAIIGGALLGHAIDRNNVRCQ